MIKADNGVIHIASGETSYVIGQRDGAPVCLWFGNRIETDDDLYSLGVDCRDEFVVTVVDGETEKEVFFKLASAAAIDKPKPTTIPTLRGDETLELTLENAEARIEVKLYYTPYTRGGIARRAVITNNSTAPLTIRIPSDLFGLPSVRALRAEKSGGYASVTTAVGAYAYLTLFGDHEDDRITLGAGESFAAPQTLAVFSDVGAGGATRALHDILREYFLPEDHTEKSGLISLELSARDATRLAASVDAFDLGADVIVLPTSVKRSTLVAAARSCSSRGIKFGLRGKLSDASTVGSLRSLIADTGAEYLCVSADCRFYADRAAFYSALCDLTAEMPDLILRVRSSDVGALGYATGLCVGANGAAFKDILPLGAICVDVGRGGKLGLKDKFDRASTFCPCYIYDEKYAGEGMRRALRAQTAMYRQNRALIVSGDLYGDDNCIIAVAKDKSRAYSVYLSDGRDRMRFVGLDGHELYRLRETGGVYSGAALANIGVDVSDVQKKSTAGFTVHREIKNS